MTFILVEPLMTYGLTDRPNLGCAMLVAQLAAEGIPVRLVPGEARRIRETFLEDADELFALVQGVREGMGASQDMARFRREVLGMGPELFREELAELYGELVQRKSLRSYFNPVRVGRFQFLHRMAFETWDFHVRILRHDDIAPVRRAASEILAPAPSCAGFSAYSRFDPVTRAVRRRVRAAGIPVIVGGPLTPHLDAAKRERALRTEELDYLVVGHAERALPDLLRALAADAEPDLPNVFFLKDGRPVDRPVEVPRGINDLPVPDFSRHDLGAYLAPELILPALTARGCSWRHCTFCAHYALDQDTYQPYRADRVVAALREYRDRWGCRRVAFHDEEIPPRRLANLCRAVLREGLSDMRFNLYSKMHRDYQDETLARLMHEAGFRMAHWGLESGSQRVLDRMRKGTDTDSMERILQVQSRHGLANCCFVILGFPGETREEALETVRFLERNRDAVDIASLSSFILQPGTPVGRDPGAFGVTPLQGGRWRAEAGMQPGEVDAFRAWLESSGTRLQSDRFYCLQPDTTSRMVVFLLACHGAKRTPDLEAPAYPLLLGRLRGSRLSRIDTARPYAENEAFAREEAEEVLDPWAARLAALADGTRSAAALGEAMGDPARARARLEAWAAERRLLVFSAPAGIVPP